LEDFLMTDNAEPTPDQQTHSGQQGNSGTDWEARYRGASTVINRLTAEKENLQGQLDASKAEAEQLRAQLGLKDTEKTAAVSERDKQIQELLQAKSALEAENAQLKALGLKVKVAKKLGKPELIEIADTIPNVTDEAALEALMSSVADWGNKLVKSREEQLLSGVTPPAGPIQAAPAAPATSEEWQKRINSMPFGPEREKAMNDWWAWEAAKH
jgi:chromosome segregation ATPase